MVLGAATAYGAQLMPHGDNPRPADPAVPPAVPPTAPSAAILNSFNGSFFQSPQHDIYRSQNLWWTFDSTEGGVVYRTSPDGIEWSQPTAILGTVAAFASWVKGDMLYYTASTRPGNVSSPYFLYGYGVLYPDGSITWGASQTQVPTEYPLSGYYDSIAVDGSGDVWVAGTVASSTVGLEVYRNSGNGTSWVLTHVVSGGFESSIGSLVPISSGMVLLYGSFPDSCCQSSPIYLTATSNEGATWSSPISPPSVTYYMSYASAVSVGDTVYVVAPVQSPWSLQFWNYTYGSNSTSPETSIASNPVSDSLSESNGTLVATYASNGSVFGKESTDLGANWSGPYLLSTDGLYATAMTSTLSGDFGVLWSGAIMEGSVQVTPYAEFYAAPTTVFPS